MKKANLMLLSVLCGLLIAPAWGLETWKSSLTCKFTDGLTKGSLGMLPAIPAGSNMSIYEVSASKQAAGLVVVYNSDMTAPSGEQNIYWIDWRTIAGPVIGIDFLDSNHSCCTRDETEFFISLIPAQGVGKYKGTLLKKPTETTTEFTTVSSALDCTLQEKK
jgi:hypothetical protein